jgi:hypothetical protein
MQLIQFVNKNEGPVEQGDVVIIGDKQAQLYQSPYGEIYPEVDLTDAVYDTRACGIVAELYVEVRVEEIKREGEGPGEAITTAGAGEASEETSVAEKGKISRRARKADKPKEDDKAEEAGALRGQTFTPEEFQSLDRTRIGPGQRGFMVVLGTYGHCKVDADIAPIKVGDLLTTSSTKGHAQKVLDPAKATGTVIGKALGGLKKGKGKIPVLVTLQ